jgi:hypothetical protein
LIDVAECGNVLTLLQRLFGDFFVSVLSETRETRDCEMAGLVISTQVAERGVKLGYEEFMGVRLSMCELDVEAASRNGGEMGLSEWNVVERRFYNRVEGYTTPAGYPEE